MKRVTGIGGVFFKSDDPEKLYQWYEKHLGLKRQPDGAVSFDWRHSEEGQKPGRTVWALFPKDTEYFQPSRSSFMVNYRVDALNALLTALREEGVEIDDHREEYEYGVVSQFAVAALYERRTCIFNGFRRS